MVQANLIDEGLRENGKDGIRASMQLRLISVSSVGSIGSGGIEI